MWLKNFYSAIEQLLGSRIKWNAEAMAQLDPDKIYVENVRNVLSTSSLMAEEICETAAMHGLFTRHIEVLSPYGGAVVASAMYEGELPEFVTVFADDADDLHEESLPTADMQRLTYYTLNDGKAEKAGLA